MSRVVSIGECMVEMAPSGEVGDYHMGFAGDTMNTAWYLRRLLPATDHVDYLTAVGTDAVSDQMVEFLDKSGIGTGHIARRSDRTVGLYMIQLKDGERSFSYWRGQSAARTVAQDSQFLAQALNGADIAYVSGITLAVLSDADRNTLFDALSTVRRAGGHVVFDPNLRPRLWQTPKEMTDAVMAAAAISDTVLPSHEDEATWFNDADPMATAQRYADAGVGCVIVKNGPGEMMALDSGTVSRHSPVPVAQVVDTTAAGDSFNAGFLAARLGGQSIADAVHAGAALAAKVVTARGALITEGI